MLRRAMFINDESQHTKKSINYLIALMKYRFLRVLEYSWNYPFVDTNLIRNEGVVGSTPMGGSTFYSWDIDRPSPISPSAHHASIEGSNAL
jgi:hypothetical protein